MTYFLSSSVCEKLGIRNSTDVFKTNNLINGRDYIKFTPKENQSAYRRLIDLGYAARMSNGVYLFTVAGLIEVLFRSKNPEARVIKDKLMNLGGYEIYESVAYHTVWKLVWNMSDMKREKFFKEESFALGYIKNAIGGENMTEDTVRSIELIRSFYNKSMSNECLVPDVDLRILVSEFNGFSLV